MANLDFAVKGRQCADKGGCGVALDQYAVGFDFIQYRFKALQSFGGDVKKRLVGLHEVEVMVGIDLKEIKYLIQHLPVLGSDANLRGETAFRLPAKAYQRRHFNGFRTGAKDEKKSCHRLVVLGELLR